MLNELRHERGEKRLRYLALCGYLAYLKEQYPFLREVHSQPLQQTVKDLDAAYGRAFNPALAMRLPRFKRKGRPMGVRFPQGFRIDGASIYLPKIGWIGFCRDRAIEGHCKSVTVSFDGQHWYVAIQTERDIPKRKHPSKSRVGIDLGVAHFAALSDGSFVEGANAFRDHQKRLALLQRRFSRKQRFSSNWRKSMAKIRRLHRKIARTRNDLLHKASTTISKNHAVVVMEDLRITNMTTSAAGSVERPGKSVRAKSALNRRILDQGWGEFRRQLAYKLEWSGGTLTLVDPRNTSRSCPACGNVHAANRRTQAAFYCIACGHAGNADTNAAINILRRAGQARIACGDSPLGESTKQEAQCIA